MIKDYATYFTLVKADSGPKELKDCTKQNNWVTTYSDLLYYDFSSPVPASGKIKGYSYKNKFGITECLERIKKSSRCLGNGYDTAYVW